MNRAQIAQSLGWLQRRALRLAIAKKLAQQAGDRGTSTPPMPTGRRLAFYMAQNGSARLTPAQRRRVTKKSNKARP